MMARNFPALISKICTNFRVAAFATNAPKIDSNKMMMKDWPGAVSRLTFLLVLSGLCATTFGYKSLSSLYCQMYFNFR